MKTKHLTFPGTIIMLLVCSSVIFGQTNDPYVLNGSQDYLFEEHKIDQAWNLSKGSSSQRIAIHSLFGVSAIHEDLQGRFYGNPYNAGLFQPEEDYSTKMAGIIGANTNNNVGMAGINWAANMRSYNFLRQSQSGDDQEFIISLDNNDYYAGFEEATAMIQQAIADNNDIHVFGFGLPTSRLDHIEFMPVYDLGLYEMVDMPNRDFFEPELPPTPEERMLDKIREILSLSFENMFYSSYQPPPPHVQYRESLIDVYEAGQLKVAAAGEVAPGTNQKYMLLPAYMDKSTLTVAGGYRDEFGGFITLDNAHEADYIDVAGYGSSVVGTSGTATDAYSTTFGGGTPRLQSEPE